MIAFIRKHRLELFVFILALAIRVLFFAASYHANGNDLVNTVQGADGYFVISENLLAGHGYSSAGAAPYSPNAIRPPVMPYFLAILHLISGSYWGPLIVEIVLGSLLPVIGMCIARYVTASRAIVATAGVLLAVEPFDVAYSSLFYSETVFTFLLLLSLWTFCAYLEKRRWDRLLLAALLLGLAALTKPTAEYIAVLFAAAMLWQGRRALKREWVRTLVFLAMFILVLAPWLYRNYETFGVVALSPQLGEQLSAILVPSVLSIAHGTSFQTEFNAVLAQGVKDPNSADLHDSGDAVRRSVPILLAHPRALAIVLGNTALNFFIHDGVFEALKQLNLEPPVLLGKPALFILLTNPLKLFGYIRMVVFEPTIAILFARIAWIAITLLFFFGCVRYVRTKPTTQGVLCIGLVFYFMLTTLVIGLSITARYRMPVNILIFIFAAYGAASAVAWLQKRRHTRKLRHA